ncbi:MAG: phosphate ABC transporter substrate-binding protein PstS [Candidatus Eremiobacteraeota bacterium]|nr:phosphate ABC transporter substrate-binding protein PstS [Candidatus Eremiobacteraeota bacterium]
MASSLGKRALVGAMAAAALSAPMVGLADTQIIGAGSSFDFPFFSRAFYEYGRNHGGLTVNYQSIGSGGGIQQFTARTVDFGASDVPLSTKEEQAARDANGPVVQVPVALGGVVIAYNVPGAPNHLHLSPDVLADIFLGQVTNWNDGAIRRLNPGARLPDLPIVVAHRADGSGTTYIFTDYLSTVSAQWKSRVGTNKTVNWPAQSSIGAKGNEGVAGQVRNSPGAIGYIELAYALENDISYAALRNKAGRFVLPSTDAIRAAAAQKPNVNPNNFSIVDQPGNESYPICGYSWAMLWQNQADRAKGRQLADLFRWLVSDGQSLAATVHYVALPAVVGAEAQKQIAKLHV